MTAITFGGLATGLDTNAIVDKLSAIERAPATALEQRKSDAQARIRTLGDLVTRLGALGAAAKAVDTPAELRGRKVTVTGAELTAEGGTSAVAGRWTVKVDQLARAQTSRSRELGSCAAGALGAGTLGIQVGANSFNVAYGATDTLDDVAAKITASGAGVSASVLDTGSGFRLVLSTTTTGTAAAATFSETGDGLGVAEIDAARDSKMTIAGTQVTRATNDVSDVITGVTLHLTAVTAGTSEGASIAITDDPTAARTKVQGLVDAYNATAKLLDGQLRYDGVKKGENTLFGDPTLQSLQRRLGTAWASAFSSVSARDLGITRAADGTMTLDAAKFDTAVAASPAKLDALMTGTDGLATTLTAAVTQMTTAPNGQITAKQAGLAARTRGYDAQIARINTRADAMAERMRKQFTALEQAVSSLQSNLTYLQSIGR